MFKKIFGEEQPPSIKREMDEIERLASEKELNTMPLDSLVSKVSTGEIRLDHATINKMSRSDSDKNIIRAVNNVVLLSDSLLEKSVDEQTSYEKRDPKKVIDTTVDAQGKLKRVPPSADKVAS